MLVYRISKTKYSGQLVASGRSNRWNKAMQYVIYTAAARSLACLELVVHLDQSRIQDSYKVTVIEIPDKLKIHDFPLESLPPKWQLRSAYMDCQKLGADWVLKQQTSVLRVPSSIIPQEHNYIINTQHLDFKRIKVLRVEDFQFDSRIKV